MTLLAIGWFYNTDWRETRIHQEKLAAHLNLYNFFLYENSVNEDVRFTTPILCSTVIVAYLKLRMCLEYNLGPEIWGYFFKGTL